MTSRDIYYTLGRIESDIAHVQEDVNNFRGEIRRR